MSDTGAAFVIGLLLALAVVLVSSEAALIAHAIAQVRSALA